MMLRSRSRWLIVGLCLAAAVACNRSLPNSEPSANALALAVLRAVAARDEPALRRLALDEQEFRRHVWPELPASRPERNLPFSYVWGDLKTKSDASLTRMLVTYGGRTYTLDRIRFAGGTTQYRSFVVHRESVLEVHDGEGRPDTLQLLGSVIEQDGRFKIFSYVTD